MERIVRNILNYDAYKATDEKQYEMCADMIAISLFLLEKTNRFVMPNKMNVTYMSNMIGGSFGKDDMKLSEEIFKREEAFLNDITIVAHETCHYGQGFHVDSSKSIKPQSGLVCTSSHFGMLMHFILNTEMPQAAQLANIFGIKAVAQMNSELNDLLAYFESYYALQSFEMEADDFSLEVVKYIISTAKKLKLSDKEKRNLKAFEEKAGLTDGFYRKRNRMIDLRKSRQYTNKIENLIQRVINNLFKMLPEYVTFLDGKMQANIANDSSLETAVALTCQALEVKYDDRLAHKLMKMLMSATPNEHRNRYIFHLGLWTKIQLTKEEENAIKELLSTTTIDLCAIPFEELMKEKQRVIKERADLKRGLTKPIVEFDFE